MAITFFCRALLRFAIVLGVWASQKHLITIKHGNPYARCSQMYCVFGQIRKVVAAAGGVGCSANLAYIPKTPNAGRYQRTKGWCG
jgi:hypothetical protein